MNISDRIHNLRKMKDISQEQFADALTWYDSQDVAAYAGMYILIIFGIMMWGIGLMICDPKTRGTAIKTFTAVNVWILSFPHSL